MSMKKMLAVVAAASLAAAAAPAFAANPFSDVPMNHWAYDAVEQLSAKGILEGYPNGTFKGNRAMTRYEIATMVARMMAAGGLSGEDLEKLKALVVEFQPELEALGVKVDGFDSRLSALEKGVGGWKISGEMQFDFVSGDNDLTLNKHGFEFDSARLFLHKDLADGLSFDAEYGDGVFDRFWLTAEDFLGWEGLTLKAGQFDIDWEDDDGLYYGEHEDSGLFMGVPYRGFGLSKTFGLAEVSGFAASNVGDDGVSIYDANASNEYYGARLKLNFNEKLWLSVNGLWTNDDTDKYKTYWAGLGFKFAEGFELKGAYYMQDIDGAAIDDPKAWKVALDVSQDVLKFTSLWAEYVKFDDGFMAQNLPYAFSKLGDYFEEYAWNGTGDVEAWLVAAKQEWNDKWSTFGRYGQYKPDTGDKVKEWAVGVGYQYTPNLYFELSYDNMDFGSGLTKGADKITDDKVIRFRTLLTF